MIASRACVQLVWLAMLLAACQCVLSPAALSEAVAAEPRADSRPIEYRRYFVPYDRPQDWPKGDTPYVPIEKEEFERLIAVLQSPPQAALGSAARISRASYEAKLVDQDLLSGQARLELVYAAQTPVLLPLDPWGLVIDRVRWDDPAAPEVVFGLASDGRLAVYVDRSAPLLIDWSLRGHRDAAGTAVFDLDLPRSAFASLSIDLPAGMLPSVSSGVIAAPAADNGRWRVELGGQNHCLLKVAPSGAASPFRRLALLQQVMRYDFSPGGLDVTAELTLDVHNEPLQQLELDVDADLQLMSARFGDLDAPWSVASTAEARGKRRIVVEFPQPLLGPRQQVQLKALAPLAAERLWTLPTIQPQGVFWQEGSVLLLVPAPLSIDRLLPLGCRQSRAGTLPAPLSGESVELQAFSPGAAVKVLLSRRREPVRLVSAAQIEVSPDRLSGTWIGEFRIDRGERLALSAEILHGWVIDSATSLPDGDVATNEASPLDLEGRVLTMHLAQALSPNHPIRLKIAAHAIASPQQRPVRAGEFEMLKFRGVSVDRRLLSAEGRLPYQLRFDGAEEQPRLEADKLSSAERQCFAEAPQGAVFDVTRSKGGWTASLEEQPPRYAAELKLEATLTPGPLLESYVIRCSPESSPVSRCLVHFSQARSEAPRWSMNAAGPEQFTARRLGAEQQTQAGLSQGETWEIVFSRPRSEPFEIRATRPTTVQGAVPLSLIALPEAGSQQGRVEVRATDAAPAVIENYRLKPAPLAADDESEYPVVRGDYRYDPAGELGLSDTPAITVARSDKVGQLQGALVWDLRLDSRYEATGRGLHLATCQIESGGRPRCALRLPPEAEVLGAWIDDAPIRHRALDGQLVVPLPRGKRFPTLEVQFAAAGPPLSVWTAYEAPWPEIDMAVLARHWLLWAPPEYELLAPEGAATGKLPLSWSQRLFGILGRPSGEAPFHPSVGEHWLGVAAAAPAEAIAADALASAGLNQGLSAPASAWRTFSRAGSRQADNVYWRNYRFDSVEGVALKVRFIDRSLAMAAGWAVLALAFALGRWLFRGRLAVLAGLAGAVACAGLLAPEAFAPVMSGALIALLGCLAIDVLAPRRSADARKPAAGSAVAARAAEALALAIVVGAGAMGVSLARGEEAPAAKSARQENAYRVFIPSDAEGKPVGGRYQIPQSLRSELRRRALIVTGEPHGWLISGAAYDVTLGRSDADARINVVDFTVRYELHVLSTNTRIRIPLSREQAGLAPDSALLDNQPLEPFWEEGGQALLCDAPAPGRCQLEFKLRPVINSALDHNSLELLIPPAPNATLKVRVPPEASGIEVPGSIGPLSWSENHDQLSAKLGPASRMTIRWPQKAGGPAPTVDVEELLWLKVRPGSVVVDARLKYRVTGGQVHQLSLAADRRFRLIPPSPDSPVAQYRASPAAGDMADSPQTIQMELSQPITDQLSLPVSLLLTETSGIGNIRLPRLEPLGAHSRRRWLAVSVDSGLEVEIQNDDKLERVDTADFTADWGKTDSQPLLAYRLPAGDSPWSLAARPREPHTTVKQILALSFEHGSAQVRFDAELMTTAGYCFQHRLLIPPALEIDSVSLQADGAERVQRWARDDEGMLNVFLSSRTTGAQRLSLRGRLPTPGLGKFPLPAIRIEASDPLPQGDLIQVFRQPAVLVSIDDRIGMAEVSEPVWEKPPEQFGRPVATLAAETRDVSAQVSLAANEPLVHCEQVTFLEYEDQVWTAKVEHRLNIEQGVVDTLRFEIPPEWTGPFDDATPPATVEVAGELASARRRLLVRPRNPLAQGRHRLSLRAPLAFADSTQVTVPDIRPLFAATEERFVVLPTQVGVEQVTWETTRLVPAELPEGFGAPSVSPEAFAVYRIVGEQPQAVLSAVERSAEMARVRLADYHLSWQGDGAALIAASFDLEPTGLSACPLRLPPDWQLVQLSVAGIPATPLPAEEGWKLPLGANRMPLRVEVIASGPVGDISRVWAGLKLPACELGDLPVDQTLWTLHSPSGWECVELGESAARIDALEAERHRLRSIAALADNLSSDTAATTPPAELENWRRIWARRLALLKTAIDRQQQLASGQSLANDDLDKVDDEWAEAAKNLGMTPLAAQILAEKPVPDQPAELWEQTHAGGGSVTRFFVHRDGQAPQVRYLRAGEAGLLRRFGAALAVALATLVVVAALRSGVVVEFVRRWPYAAGVVAGLAWWLWLSPSILGWLLILTSVAAAFRRPSHSIREPSSAIIAVGRP